MALRCAIVGSGNIGTDLMMKIRRSDLLELAVLIGIDPASDGLARARDLGVTATADGIGWLEAHPGQADLVLDATSAYVHRAHAEVLSRLGLPCIDLTPAALGPKVVPGVNLDAHLDAPDVNMVTCGGQATVPVVAAVSRAAPVPYAEMVSTVASVSAGPGTRQNIDEFTRTTALALSEIGGAGLGKAIIILNPADPPILMRNTVFCALPDGADHQAVLDSVLVTVAGVAAYVPGYRLIKPPVIEEGPFGTPGGTVPHRVVIMIEVAGAGDYLPAYAGNLDIMTSAAVRVAEARAQRLAGVAA